MGAEKRTSTTPGMGAVRDVQPMPTARRIAPITVPSLRIPRVEDLAKGEEKKRDTLKRSPSAELRKIDASSMRVEPGAIPVAARHANTPKDAPIQPTDAFLLSRIDGELRCEELADLTGMSYADVLASVQRLVHAGLVTIT